MTEADFLRIKDMTTGFSYNSLEHTDYEDIAGYEIKKKTGSIILISGFHREADCMHYHWGANEAKQVLDALGKDSRGMIEFIPGEWVKDFENEGFVIRDVWKDYFMDSITDIPTIKASELEEEFLKEYESKGASDATIACKGQSRGFTGQTEEWIKEWLDNSAEEDVVNKVALVERNEAKEIIGLVFTGIYGLESMKGPIAWIREVSVIPEYQNRGIARSLIRKALGYCKSNGATRAFLTADECNIYAIHLYESIGFRPGPDKGQIDMVRE
ncbi:GNAT family N-acetyltransferase [Anaerocolumna xylanovorans]|uniref:Acetyltransferase (GNAT) family protein n=1 Tax=Anaerocolumna xylanovorans DSM 12503 TaxID=1121345 RepID=A0A1M7YJ76_9FIRM|nr:GNAT family N-acetyltransferase [Anaerocolumna xylanovorans]SHO52673.1 Acetyltransferase (GNAT) family protein [Anaerocolumna xylanovorans DSM 12503]